MKRRTVLSTMAVIGSLTSGCTTPTVTETPTGEIDVEFRTEATRDVLVSLELVDADGTIEEEFESGFPPDQQGAPSFYAAGLSSGPYTVTIGTDSDTETFEWSITECPRLDVDVTVLADAQLAIERTCSSP